ncbi:hypothetical protein [Psychrobacillus sp. FSL K6-2843]|uniref:hypothetical protein n=1 Tax=Psychrobacillus sp. FSL K6-2843 TaxID=2921549 RepID=UPI00315A55EB
MAKKSIYLIALVLLFSTLFSPIANAEKTENEKSSFYLDGVKFELEVENSSKSEVSLKLNGEKTSDSIVVNLETEDFTITDVNGNTVTYNANDFVVEDDKNENAEEDTSTDDMSSIKADRSYITDPYSALGMPTTATMTTGKTYTNNALDVTPYKFTWNAYTKTMKKYSFSKSTAISTILGVIITVSGVGFTIGAVTSILTGLGVSVVSEILAHATELGIGVKTYYTARIFYVYGKGHTIKTKKWDNYLETTHEGKNSLEYYSSDDYATWYNARIDSQVADVAYQQYRYIASLRSEGPYGQEFAWY